MVERIEILRLMVEGGARDWFVLDLKRGSGRFCGRPSPVGERRLRTHVTWSTCSWPAETWTSPISLAEGKARLPVNRLTQRPPVDVGLETEGHRFESVRHGRAGGCV